MTTLSPSLYSHKPFSCMCICSFPALFCVFSHLTIPPCPWSAELISTINICIHPEGSCLLFVTICLYHCILNLKDFSCNEIWIVLLLPSLVNHPGFSFYPFIFVSFYPVLFILLASYNVIRKQTHVADSIIWNENRISWRPFTT